MDIHKDDGFTLVELAIVLMIIGLLIAGVLRGQEMMENARIGQMVKQIQSYQAAVVTFNSTYNMLPGDITNAASRVPNCSQLPCSSPGNGDGLIGNYRGSESSGNDITVTDTSENRTVWLHLAASHLLSGINSSASFTTPSYGVQFPATPFEGGFHMVSSTSHRSLSTGAYTQSNAGLLLFVTNTPANIISFSAGSMPSYPLTPHEAHMADQKMDDGLPYTGEMQTVGPSCFAQGGSGYGGGGTYDEPNIRRSCAMTVKIM